MGILKTHIFYKSFRPLLAQSSDGFQNHPCGSHARPCVKKIQYEYIFLEYSIFPKASNETAFTQRAIETSLIR